MKCFIYRYPEGAQISVFNPDLDKFEDVDPVEHIEAMAAERGLKHARVKRTVTVCVADDDELLQWSTAAPVQPFMKYLGYR